MGSNRHEMGARYLKGPDTFRRTKEGEVDGFMNKNGKTIQADIMRSIQELEPAMKKNKENLDALERKYASVAKKAMR